MLSRSTSTFASLPLPSPLRAWLVLVPVIALAGCGDSKPRTHGIYMLLDTSGTYTRELDKAKQIINAILSQLNPGDSFAVARIDTASFSERDIVAKITFDPAVTSLEELLERTEQLGAELVDPIKTVNVQHRRCMTNWVWRRR